jgi:hypothetical protein
MAMNKHKHTEDAGIKVGEKAPDTRQIKSFVSDPCPFDVLLGRGLLVNNYTGNIFYRNLIASKRAEYLSTQNRQKKHEIALQILSVIRNEKGGRFLRELKTSAERAQVGLVLPLPHTKIRSNLSRVWIIVDDRTSTRKIKHALRDPDSSSLMLGTPRSASLVNHQFHEQNQEPSMHLTHASPFEQPNTVRQFSNNRLYQNETLIPTQLVNSCTGILQSDDPTPLLSYQQSVSEQNVASGVLPRNNMTKKTSLSPNKQRTIETIHPETRQVQSIDFRSHNSWTPGFERYSTACILLQQLRQQHKTIIHQNEISILRRLALQNHYQGSVISPTGLIANPGVLSLPQQLQWHLLQGTSIQLRNQQNALLSDSTASTATQSSRLI